MHTGSTCGMKKLRKKMATKYKEYFELMMQNNKQVFEEFREIHDRYALNPENLQEEFNEKGGKIMRIVREWEDKLCNRSEGTGYGKFTANLAEKFQNEVRREFSEIDKVGVKVFKVNKINLSS